MSIPEESGPAGNPEPPRDALSNIDGIQNLDTARMALRWALEKLRALERDAGGNDDLRKRLERDFAGRRIALEREFQNLRTQIVSSTERRIRVLEERLFGAQRQKPGSQEQAEDFVQWRAAWEGERDSLLEELRRTRFQAEPSPPKMPRSEQEEKDLAERLAETERARLLSEQTRQHELAKAKADALKHELETAHQTGKTSAVEGMLNATRELLSRAQTQSGEAQQVWRKQLDKLAAEAQALRREMDDRAAREAQTLARATVAEQATQRARQENERHLADFHALQQERTRLLDDAAEAQRNIQDQLVRRSELEARLQAASQAQERVREELSRAAVREAELSTQREAMQRRADEALARAAETNIRLQGLEADYQRQREAAIKEADTYRSESEARALKLQAEIDALRDRVRHEAGACAAATDRVAGLERSLELEKQGAESARNDLENLRRQLHTTDETFAGLHHAAEERKAELSAELAKARRAIAEQRARGDELEARQSGGKAELEVARRSLEAAQASLQEWTQSASAQARAAAQREEALLAERAAAVRGAEEASARAIELSTRLALLETDHQRHCAAPAYKEEVLRKESEAHAQKLQAELDVVRERLMEANAAAAVTEERTTTLGRALEEESLRTGALRQDLENSRRTLKATEDCLAELRRSSEERQAELAAELAGARQTIEEQQARGDKLEAQFIATGAALEAAQRSLRTVEGNLRGRAQESSAEAITAAGRATELATRLAAREADYERLRATAAQEAEAQRTEFEDRARRLQEEVDSLQLKLGEEAQSRNKTKDELSEARAAADANRARSLELEAQLARVVKQLDGALSQEAEGAARGHSQADALAQSLQGEINKLRRQLAVASDEREAGLAQERRRAEEALKQVGILNARLEEVSQSATQARALASIQLEKERVFWREQAQPLEAELQGLRKQLQDQAGAAAQREEALLRERDALQGELLRIGAESDRMKTESADRQRLRAEVSELRHKIEPAEELRRRQVRIEAWERAVQDEYRRKKAEVEALRRQFLAELDEVSKGDKRS